ncbi:hypothetical protein H257_17808 [Aphanomyces astaci]|uniref:Uncharacterized protein n=1 Tax=Aphanomyces astaci TaxID=112090 RepID=W4FF53_APHAT|nr:hypothetical protein H257_17808 [Aphanomyces astaci]ETV65471.1 hypothetical protein H257_17808 [Aphanomyces astaci]|eukprot:XP_009845053.1 hypothetical protein H257_17808 [Aphanomyces astaci]
MPTRYIWAVRGGSSKISSGEKHSLRMTAVLTIMYMYEESLPPNVTYVCQPLDVGVMALFKRNLRKLWHFVKKSSSGMTKIRFLSLHATSAWL